MKQIMTTKTTYKKGLQNRFTKSGLPKSYHIDSNQCEVTKKKRVTY